MARELWILPAMFLGFGAPAWAAADGVISGRVLNGSGEGGEVGATSLSLFAPELVRDGVLAESVSDNMGRFVFRDLDTDVTYILGARYQGIPYITSELRFEGGQSLLETVVEVFEKAETGEKIRFPQMTMFVDLVPESDDFFVRESIHVENRGGSYMSPRFDSPTLRVRLPHGAKELQIAEGLLGGLAEISGGELVYRGPVYPGASRIVVGYVAPATSFRRGFVRHLAGDVDVMEIHVGAGVPELTDSGLEPVGRSTAHGGGYDAWQGRGFSGGQHLTLRFDGQAVGSAPTPWGSWLALGAMMLSLLAYVGWPIVRPVESAGVLPVDLLEHERFRAFDAVRELDEDHSMGKLTDEDHAEMRLALKAKAIDVMHRIDAMRTDENASIECADCGQPAGDRDRFCAQCGAALDPVSQ